MGMIGFKAFDENLTCRGFQYEIGHIYELIGEPIPCERGFHFCKSIAETYNYYGMNENTRICKVEAIGDIKTDDGIKYCTNAIKICEEVTEDWERKGNTNSSSSGYCNTGDRNTGTQNTGERNTGNWNTGTQNSGNRNTGYGNTGNWNVGDMNVGNWNTGNRNTGDWNTGYDNIGDLNTGNRNIGYGNTGDWNITRHSSGCFNTEEKNIIMFNKPTNWTFNQWIYSRARAILNGIPNNIVEWVRTGYMSDEEKEEYPTYKTTEGYLKVIDKEDAAQEYWNGLSEEDKQEIYNLPNFDKDIFKQCTGIEV